MQGIAIKVDFERFSRAAKKIANKEFPQKVVAGFSYLAMSGAKEVRRETGSRFRLHSNYITRGIKSIPFTSSQKKSAENAVRKWGDIFAAVYLRGSTVPKYSLEFMADHEDGDQRKPHGTNTSLAIPTRALRRKSGFKTSRGAVRKRWKPETLLERFKSKGSDYDGITTTNRGRTLGPQPRRVPGHAFLIQGRQGSTMIARRKTLKGGKDNKNLEFLYSLGKTASIKPRWHFEPTVYTDVKNKYASVIIKYLSKMRTR